MKIKKFQLNNGFVASVLMTPLLALTGCGPRSDCELAEYHLHKYEKNGIVRYMDDEHLKVDGFIWTSDLVYADSKDDKLHKFEKKKDLIKIEDNVDYIASVEAEHEDFLEYRYAYTYLVPVPHYVHVGKTSYTYFTYIPTTHHSWTTDPEHSRLTGEERLCHYVYNGYKVEKNENGKYQLIPSEDVEDLLTIKDDYPYMKEKFYKTIVIGTGEEADYEDGKNDKEDNIVPEEHEDKYEEGKEIDKEKVYQKTK